MTVKEATEIYKNHTLVNLKKGTQDFYKFYFPIVNQYLGDIECDKLNKFDIENMIRRLRIDRPKMKNISINKVITTLKVSVRYATDIRIEYRKLTEEKKVIETIKMETINKIWRYYRARMSNKYMFRDYVFLKLMLDTGLRMNEMINLKVTDVDLDTNAILVKVTKTNGERYVVFTDSTRKLLLKYILNLKIRDYLFIDFNTNKPLTTSAVECMLYRLKKKLKIEDNITPHKWRHTFGTHYLRSGGELETLRLLLGHSNLRTTQRYLHLTKEDIVQEYMSVMKEKASF